MLLKLAIKIQVKGDNMANAYWLRGWQVIMEQEKRYPKKTRKVERNNGFFLRNSILLIKVIPINRYIFIFKWSEGTLLNLKHEVAKV